MPHPARQITIQEYIDTVHDGKKRMERFSEQIRQLSGETQLNNLNKALQSLRGVSEIVSAVVVSELGDLTRFDSPANLMAYLGLVPSQHNSGDKKNQEISLKQETGTFDVLLLKLLKHTDCLPEKAGLLQNAMKVCLKQSAKLPGKHR
jgi:transposase